MDGESLLPNMKIRVAPEIREPQRVRANGDV